MSLVLRLMFDLAIFSFAIAIVIGTGIASRIRIKSGFVVENFLACLFIVSSVLFFVLAVYVAAQ